MSKIDVGQWKEFKISDLFSVRPSKYIKKNGRAMSNIELLDDGDHPVIVNSSEHNGIGGYTSQVVTEPGNVITYSDTVNGNTVFYQAKSFVGYSHVKVMEPKVNLDSASMIFLTTVIRKCLMDGGYDFVNKMTTNRVLNTIIKLPVTSSGEPDWQYMDSYIAERAEFAHKYVSELKSTNNQRKPLKISGWQEYKLTDLFTGCDCLIARGQRIKQRDRISGTIPLVTAGMENQGVADTIADNGVNILYPADSITIDMFGNTFCHNGPFYADDNILILHNSKYHYDELLFIAAVVNKTARRMSSYKSQFRMNSLNKLTIKLPALSDGTPDWATMRKRVAHLAALSHRDVTSLDPAELPIFMGDWQEFKIGQLFDIETGGDLVFRNLLEGEIPVVSHSMENNGVKGYYQRIEGRKCYDHEITLALADRGTFFASSQTKDFYVATRVKALIFKDRKYINENIRLFLCSVINRLVLRFADYSENATNRLPSSVIKLPVDINGNPDWHYMDNYVVFMKSIADRHVGSFQSIVKK